MTKRFSVIIERDQEGYYVASVPSLRGCHTQAKSLDQLIVRIREAIELCMEVEGNDVEPLDFIGVQQVSVSI
jgi:predicted RNase H-like HicB family nuclease